MGLVYNRNTKETYEDIQYGIKYLHFLYDNCLGRLLLKIITMPFISKCFGRYYDTHRSTKKIEKFIKDNNIDMSLYEKEDYNSFNEFFYRKKIIPSEIKKNFEKDDIFISPADSKLLCYKISDELKLDIKNSSYDIEELLGRKENLDKFKNGNVLVFRLAVDDYHRYCFLDSGKMLEQYEIKGKLHTVSSVSKRYKIYKENHRVVSKLLTNNFDQLYYIEVGALLVGKIVNHDKKEFKKGEEKGHFKFGGSTIVVITKDNIIMDDDIIKNSLEDIETKIQYGEKIGIKK